MLNFIFFKRPADGGRFWWRGNVEMWHHFTILRQIWINHLKSHQIYLVTFWGVPTLRLGTAGLNSSLWVSGIVVSSFQSFCLKLPGLQLHTALLTNTLIQFVIISQRRYIAGPNAKHFTGLSTPPDDTLEHSQPWNKDRQNEPCFIAD